MANRQKPLCFIFDQDGTLYAPDTPLFRHLRAKTKSWLQTRFALPDYDLDILYARLQTDWPNPLLAWMSLGLTVEDYHAAVFDAAEPCRYLQRDNSLVRVLLQLPARRYVVTLASEAYSIAVQECLGIRSLISETYYASRFPPTYDKALCYIAIAQSLQLRHEQICVVGDNFAVDIAPALRHGFRAVHVASLPVAGSHTTISDLPELPGSLRTLA